MDKFLAFEYLICLFIEWYKDIKKDDGYKQSFSKLTVLKLLFFTAATQRNKCKESDLLDVFNEFYALPHGPVEVDIYSRINNVFNVSFSFSENKNAKLYFSIGNNSLDVTDAKTSVSDIKVALEAQLEYEHRQSLINSLSTLKSLNEKLVTYDPFTLVGISHKWTCWKTNFNTAQILGKRSKIMSVESIRESDKYYI